MTKEVEGVDAHVAASLDVIADSIVRTQSPADLHEGSAPRVSTHIRNLYQRGVLSREASTQLYIDDTPVQIRYPNGDCFYLASRRTADYLLGKVREGLPQRKVTLGRTN